MLLGHVVTKGQCVQTYINIRVNPEIFVHLAYIPSSTFLCLPVLMFQTIWSSLSMICHFFSGKTELIIKNKCLLEKRHDLNC